MSVEDDLHAYLSANGQGTALYIGGLPDEPDAVASVWTYDDDGPIFNHETPTGPAYEQPLVQVLVRGDRTGEVAALARSYAMWRLLNIANQTINGTRYQRVRPLGSPRQIQIDENDRPVYACDYYCMKEAFGG